MTLSKTGFRHDRHGPEAFDHAKLGRVGLDIMYLNFDAMVVARVLTPARQRIVNP